MTTVLLAAEGVSLISGVGIERYNHELIRLLPSYEIEVKAAISNPPRIRFSLAVNAFTKLPVRVISMLRGVSLVHATDPSCALSLPTTGIPTVTTFHDLMALRLRAAPYTAGDRLFAATCAAVSLTCDSLIAVSTQTKADLVETFSVDPEKVKVISLGASAAFQPRDEVQREKLTVGYVGDVTPRKRIDILLEAFAEVRRSIPAARLILVGKSVAQFLSSESEKILRMTHDLQLDGAVTFHGRVSEEELVRLYNKMRVLVMPSEYEGFGLPILEAERCGTPVIVRKGTRIPDEVRSSCAKAGSVTELAERIIELMEDEGRFERASESALRHSAPFTWERCVGETAALYQTLLSRR